MSGYVGAKQPLYICCLHSLISGHFDIDKYPPMEYTRCFNGDFMNIYFILSGDFIKIGRTDDPDPYRRMFQMQTGNPIELQVLKFIRDSKISEIQLHKRFQHLWARGEWFQKTDELIQFIESVNGETEDNNEYDKGIETGDDYISEDIQKFKNDNQDAINKYIDMIDISRIFECIQLDKSIKYGYWITQESGKICAFDKYYKTKIELCIAICKYMHENHMEVLINYII